MLRSIRRYAPLAIALLATGSRTAPDDLDAFVMSQITMRHVAGLSLAIIDGGRIVDARAYGVTDAGQARRVDTTTLFQAGSISKPVAAMNALRLVEAGKLDLDADINTVLKTWKLPSSTFTTSKPVTLRALLSHTGGLTVHGFPGYATDAKMPTLVQVLDGSPPANTSAIRNDAVPDERYNYSGGGYTIMQLMVLDVTGKAFPDVMRENVLAPLGMGRSTYEQPLPRAKAQQTAAGHYQDGSLVVGRSHIYPEMAAAGLWTTPSDLARFAIAVQGAYAGKPGSLISQAMAKRMLTPVKSGYALGLQVIDTGTAMRFAHNGRDEGFDADMTATANTGQGAVIMINANEDSRMVARIRNFIATKYHWPNAVAFVAPKTIVAPAGRIDAIAGRYEVAPNQMVGFMNHEGGLWTRSGGHPDEQFVFVDTNVIASTERPVRFSVSRDASGAVIGLMLSQGAIIRPVPRIGPLVKDLPARVASDAALDARVKAMLGAVANGTAATVAGVTEGFRKDFATTRWDAARDITSLTYLGATNVEGRGIVRHDGTVARVLYYRMTTPKATKELIVHVTLDGVITDYDEIDG